MALDDPHGPAFRRLPLPLRPLPAEILRSYLGRLQYANRLKSSWSLALRMEPHLPPVLAALTGRPEKQLVFALPELRSDTSLQRWPQLAGEVSAKARIRFACSMCVRARVEHPGPLVQVFAAHEQLVCQKHHRWLGSGELKCAYQQQFSIDNCPEILAANMFHKILIRRWGRGRVRAAFYDASDCVAIWSQWPIMIHNYQIRSRWRRLGITDDMRPSTPAVVAACYPTTVALTELILMQRRTIEQKGLLTPDVARLGRELLKDMVIAGLETSGAGDCFLQALLSDRPEPQTEVENPEQRHHPR